MTVKEKWMQFYIGSYDFARMIFFAKYEIVHELLSFSTFMKMKRFGFVYGITNDLVTVDQKMVQSDVYLFQHIAKRLDQNWKTDLLFWDDFADDPQKLYTYDLLYIIWDPMSVFHWKQLNKLTTNSVCTNFKTASNYERLLKKISCKMSPSVDMLTLMKHKGIYYEYLEQNKLPIASFFYVDRRPDVTAAHSLWNNATACAWTKLITKPSWGSCCTMVRCFDLKKDRQRFLEYVDLLATQKYPGLTIQEFQSKASDYFEIRTFWIRGEYKYAIGTKSEIYCAKNANEEDGLDITHITTFDDAKMKNGKFGEIDHRYIRKELIEIGKKVVELPIFKKEFMLRIDFLRADSGKYFINEVEACWSRIFPENIDKVNEMAEAFVALNAHGAM